VNSANALTDIDLLLVECLSKVALMLTICRLYPAQISRERDERDDQRTKIVTTRNVNAGVLAGSNIGVATTLRISARPRAVVVQVDARAPSLQAEEFA